MAWTWNETITAGSTKAKKIHISSTDTGALAKNVNQEITDLLNNKNKCTSYGGLTPSTITAPSSTSIIYNDANSLYNLVDALTQLATFCATAKNPNYGTVQNAPNNPTSHSSHNNPHNPATNSTANSGDNQSQNSSVNSNK